MKYDVHFQANVLAEQNSADPEVRRILPPNPTGPSSLGIFDRYYMYVGTIEAASLDALFELCQNGGGGLGDPTIQKFVCRRLMKTTMSVGDIAVEHDSGKVWLCGGMGWKSINL